MLSLGGWNLLPSVAALQERVLLDPPILTVGLRHRRGRPLGTADLVERLHSPLHALVAVAGQMQMPLADRWKPVAQHLVKGAEVIDGLPAPVARS
jgi:hypothetical protein